MKRSAGQLVLGSAVAMGVCGASGAQLLIPSAGVPPLKRVDAGIADVGPLSVSNRLMPADLRVPTGFEGVYSFEQRDNSGALKTYFVRSDGALTAIFPKSEYVATRNGVEPVVPPGTIWVLGPLKIQEPAKLAPPRAFNALDYSIHPGAPVAPAERARPPVPVIESIWDDEAYRRRRVGRLLDSVRR